MDILLVDDDDTLRQSLLMLLQSEGYTVSEASHGQEAIDKAREHYFDLVLCDVRMPGIDGIETINQLKESIADAHFIVMTGYASEDAPIKALRLGVDDYISKPFDIPTFLEKLRALARRRKKTSQKTAWSLGSFIASLKEHVPELAEHHQDIEEKCSQWSRALKIPQESQELLRMACWYYPLCQRLDPSQTLPKENAGDENSGPTDDLALLLRRVSLEADPDPVVDILRALIPGNTPLKAESLDPRVQELLKNDSPPSPASAPPIDTQQQYDLEVTTLGRLSVKVKGKVLDRKSWQSANARWLFIYLLQRGGQSVPEDRLAETFWPGSPASKAHRALVSSIHRARKALGEQEFLVRYDRSYGISRDCSYRLDSQRLLDRYKEGTKHFYHNNLETALNCFQEVLNLYQGPYLPDCHDEWCVKQRAELKLKAVDAAEKAAYLLLERNPSQSEHYCRRAIELEPSSEPAWATLLRALAAQNRRSEVETAYRECVKVLLEQLQLRPGSSLRQSYQESLAD